MSAIAKYHDRVLASNSLVCVGLDPDFAKLSEDDRRKEFPQFEFNKRIIEQTHKYVSAFKPNMAFYESRGEQGLHELRLTMEYLAAEHPDVFTICDAKRGDVGNTNEHYAKAIFDDLGFDAATVQPYLGSEPLKPFLEHADKVTIVLCRTSNAGAREFQDCMVNGKPLWQTVAEQVRDNWNERGNCMLVVGATYPDELKTLRTIMGDMTFLVPGVGSQGGEAEAVVRAGLTAEKGGLIINSSRGIIFSENPESAARELRDQINAVRNHHDVRV